MFGWKASTTSFAARPAESSGAMNGVLITGQSGFVTGTCVASNLGWRAVEALSVGDKVLTFDHGMQTIMDIQRETMVAPDQMTLPLLSPILVPEGAMNNRKDLWLMPDLGMLVESDAATDALGDPFAVVPARSLKGLRGIRSAPSSVRLEITTLSFAQDEVVYVEGGMLAHCPRPRSIMTEAAEDNEGLYDVLDMHSALSLVECLIEEDNCAALICHDEEIAGVVAVNTRPARPLPVFA
jgi:hypothetical protein